MHLLSKGMQEKGKELEDRFWERLEGGAVWSGLKECYKGKVKESVVLLLVL